MQTAKSRALLRSARVTPIRPPSDLSRGQAALARGEWRDARRAFQAVLDRDESPEALEGLGLAAWWLDQADLVFQSRERAYRLYRHRGDAASAARVAVWLAWDAAAFRGEMPVATGWLERARHLLDELPECPEDAWLGVRDGGFALLHDNDPDRALALATEAVRVAKATGAFNYEMIGAGLSGFSLVTLGRVADGMRKLDEVSAAVLAGELKDPVAIALSGCYLVGACERVRDSRRAVQWCRRIKAFCESWGLKPLLAICRTQYASVCVWRGEWAEAERELVKATHELVAARPAMTSEGQARLGELKRRQGKLADAEALFEEAGEHPIARLGRAAIALDRGDADRAADLAERQLRRMPSHNLTERAAVLELLVRARVATGALDKARIALSSLTSIAERMSTLSLRASAAMAAGLVAARDGTDDDARLQFEDAIDAYDEAGAPYESAQARLELAGVLHALGRPEPALRDARRALETFKDLRATRDVERAQSVEDRLKTPAAPGRSGASGLSSREVEVVRLIAKGLSNPRIADRLFISGHTVHRHVANVLLKLNVRSRSAIVARAAALGLLID